MLPMTSYAAFHETVCIIHLHVIFLHHTDVDDRLDQHNFVAHTDPRRIGNAGAMDQIPLGQPSHGKKKLRMLLDLMVRKHYPVPLEEENGSMHRVLNKRITLR